MGFDTKARAKESKTMSVSAKYYIYGVVAAGAAVSALSLVNATSPQLPGWLLYLLLSMLGSLVVLKLPGTRGGTYSLSFLLLLFGIVHFSLAETLVAGCAGALVQTVCSRKKRPTPIQVLFNMANLALSVSVCFVLARVFLSSGLDHYRAALMAFIACTYFVVNTVLVSGVLTLLEGKRFAEVCEQWYVWSFPYYLVGAALVGLIPSPGRPVQPEAWLILLPLLYLVHFFLGLQELRVSSGTGGGNAGGALPPAARWYVLTMIGVGMIPLVVAAAHWQSQDPARFVGYLATAVAASTLKVRLPRVKGTISVSFVLLLVAIAQLSFSETVVMSALVAAVQSVWRPKRRVLVLQVLFNLASLSLSAALAYVVCRWTEPLASSSEAAVLIAATLILYFSNTIMVSVVLSLVEPGSIGEIWRHCYFWCCPYYLVGAAAAGLMTVTSRAAGWPPSLLLLPLMALVYLSYRAHVAQAVNQHPAPSVD
jgi:hypothetical protein